MRLLLAAPLIIAILVALVVTIRMASRTLDRDYVRRDEVESEAARIAALRIRSLEAAAKAYGDGKPGLAAEHERTAEALLRQIEEVNR